MGTMCIELNAGRQTVEKIAYREAELTRTESNDRLKASSNIKSSFAAAAAAWPSSLALLSISLATTQQHRYIYVAQVFSSSSSAPLPDKITVSSMVVEMVEEKKRRLCRIYLIRDFLPSPRIIIMIVVIESNYLGIS